MLELETTQAKSQSAAGRSLFVLPTRGRSGFRASVRGHVLELADPDADHDLAPTPDDLLVASIASELAWSAQRLLRARGLPDYVSVSGEWRTHDARPLSEVDLTVTLSTRDEDLVATLGALLEGILAERSWSTRPHVRVQVS